MTFDLSVILTTALANTISGLVSNIFYILLFVWAVKLLSKEIRSLAKDIPKWLQQYFKLQNEQQRLIWAKEGMRRL